MIVLLCFLVYALSCAASVMAIIFAYSENPQDTLWKNASVFVIPFAPVINTLFAFCALFICMREITKAYAHYALKHSKL